MFLGKLSHLEIDPINLTRCNRLHEELSVDTNYILTFLSDMFRQQSVPLS